MNIKVSKKCGFDDLIYNVEGDPIDDDSIEFLWWKIQPIIFLSKLLTLAEKKYWLIELETASLVWIIWKVRHLIDFIKRTTVIFTNHSAAISIAYQIHLTITTSTNKLNLCLVRASQIFYNLILICNTAWKRCISFWTL